MTIKWTIVNTAASLQVVGKTFPSAQPIYSQQQQPAGFLDAIASGLLELRDFSGNILVLPANMPLLQPDTTLQCLETMIAEGPGTAQVSPPFSC